MSVTKGLTDKQKKFAECYHQCGNATQSAIEAGYSPNGADSQGSRLLNNIKVKKYLHHLRMDEGVEFDMDLSMVIEELTKIIQSPSTKPHYKIEAIQMLSRLKGWMKQDTKVEITNNNTTPISDLNEEELQKRIESILSANARKNMKLGNE